MTQVIVTLGLDQGHVSRAVFDALVIVTIAVAVMGPLLMVPFAKRLTSEQEVAQ